MSSVRDRAGNRDGDCTGRDLIEEGPDDKLPSADAETCVETRAGDADRPFGCEGIDLRSSATCGGERDSDTGGCREEEGGSGDDLEVGLVSIRVCDDGAVEVEIVRDDTDAHGVILGGDLAEEYVDVMDVGHLLPVDTGLERRDIGWTDNEVEELLILGSEVQGAGVSPSGGTSSGEVDLGGEGAPDDGTPVGGGSCIHVAEGGGDGRDTVREVELQ